MYAIIIGEDEQALPHASVILETFSYEQTKNNTKLV